MKADREVHLRWEHRTVTVGTVGYGHETTVYPGIAITRSRGGQAVGEVWVPIGVAESTDNDDEALIAAIHDAWLWRNSAA
ncbi:hypothetical protein ACIQUM_33070 [Amycolatopsis azurea]|uniref:hypothetical protein n=1 Tax=Amycolatopsis azurea TaxID=36819 RepID=UPI00380AF80F